jgi:hypothetical protein
MCISPSTLDNGLQVACKTCWQCRKRKIADYVGRSIAEARMANKTYAVTLTYGDDNLEEHELVNTVTLVYKDVQDFLKKLRKKYQVRYIVTGEYGSAKGRAHWHIILFFKNEYPDVQTDKRVDWKYWDKGFSYFQHADWKGFEYCLKYILKGEKMRSADNHLAMSKKPPLGHEFFQQLAKQYVEQALVPQTYFYKFGDVRDYKNREKSFMMTGKTKENFMETFINEWEAKYDHEPLSEIVNDYYDDITDIEYTDEEMYERLHYKPVQYVEPWDDNQGDGIFKDDIMVEAEYDGIPIIYWENKNKTGIQIYTETDEWHEERPEVIKTIKQGQQIKRRRTHAEVLYAELDEE